MNLEAAGQALASERIRAGKEAPEPRRRVHSLGEMIGPFAC